MRFATKFWPRVGAAIAAALCYAGPAAADTASFEDKVFRYRAGPDTFGLSLDVQLVSQGAGHPTQLEARAGVAAVTTEPGCKALLVAPVSTLFEPSTRVVCPLPEPVGGRPGVRYRLSLTRSSDAVRVGDFKGIAFAGPGNDEVVGDRIYGGRGQDELSGSRVFGGRGHDDVEGSQLFGGPGVDRLFAGYPYDVRAFVMRGGPGGDEMSGGGRVYGGQGGDSIEESSSVGDMFVGGPGRDSVNLLDRDRAQDITRLRGGGADEIVCDGPIDGIDVLLVDRSDRVGARCRTGRVLLSGRPRRLWP